MKRPRIVITGIGIVCALGGSIQEVLANMLALKSGIGKVSRFPTDTFSTSIGGEIANVVTPQREGPLLDRCSLYAIVAARQAIDHSKICPNDELKKGFGIAMGTCNGGIASLEEVGTLEKIDAERAEAYLFFKQTETVARALQLTGPLVTINTACAASGNAIGYGYDMIASGEASAMLVGGSDALSSSVFGGFNALHALSPVPCAPYSLPMGLTLGEGAAFMVMETLESALARKADILGEIGGYGLSNDAYHATAPEPAGRGVTYAVKAAVRAMQLPLSKIAYINSHGTGTPANDAAELTGLRNVFGSDIVNVPLSSTKGYFGHTLGAAAAIEFVTTLMLLRQGIVPTNINYSTPRAGCEDAQIVRKVIPFDQTKWFLCNNSAFGGHNVSVLAKAGPIAPTELVEQSDPKPVYIIGLAMASEGSQQFNLLQDIAPQNCYARLDNIDLKRQYPHLYERRMNRLTQLSIWGCHEALKDASVNPLEHNVGLVHGTSRGSLESAAKYLTGIFANGPGKANALHFPDMVMNSTAGRVSQKLQITGYASALSTGGNDGQVSAQYAYELVSKGYQPYCLACAADEQSSLSGHIDRVLGLDGGVLERHEGVSAMVLASQQPEGVTTAKAYAQIAACSSNYCPHCDMCQDNCVGRLVEQVLAKAATRSSDLSFIMYSDGRQTKGGNIIQQLHCLDSFVNIPVLNWSDICGYSESSSSLSQLCAAAILIGNPKARDAVFTASHQNSSRAARGRYVLVLSTSFGGNQAATLLEKC